MKTDKNTTELNLTKDNWDQWIKEFCVVMLERLGITMNPSDFNFDEYFELSEGMTPLEAVTEEYSRSL